MEILAPVTFPVLVALSVAFLVVHILLQAQLATRELGSQWNAGPRDDGLKPEGKLADRAERALRNFQETYPAFIGLALALAVSDAQSTVGKAGAVLWFAARIGYIPLYLGGVPYIRSLVWLVSLVGLLAMFLAVLF